MIKGFFSFIKEQGIVGLAVGFVMGSSVSKVVSSFIDDIVDPLLGFMLGHDDALKEAYVQAGSVKVTWGNFVNTTLEFLVIAFVIYLVVRLLGLCPPGQKCN